MNLNAHWNELSALEKAVAWSHMSHGESMESIRARLQRDAGTVWGAKRSLYEKMEEWESNDMILKITGYQRQADGVLRAVQTFEDSIGARSAEEIKQKHLAGRPAIFQERCGDEEIWRFLGTPQGFDWTHIGFLVVKEKPCSDSFK